MLGTKKNDTVGASSESVTKAAPYTVCTIGNMRVSFFGTTNLFSFSADMSDSTYFRGCWEILCVRSGFITLALQNGAEKVILPGELAFICPEEQYKIKRIGENTERTSFFIGLECVKAVVAGHFSEYEYYTQILRAQTGVRLLDGQVFLPLIEKIGKVLKEWEAGVEHIVQAYLSVLFIEMCSALSEGEARPHSGDVTHDDRLLHKTHRRWVIENFISNNYVNDNPTEELMQQLFLSKRQTDRVVYQLMGESLATLITKQRLIVAEQLLQSTDLTLQEISERIGYHSYSGFYNAVRKYKGETPDRLLQRIRKGI